MSSAHPAAAAIHWRAWNAEAFALARATAKPILLSIATRWSEGCREMDRLTFADPDIAATVNASFVPIRLDADERPDLADRYDLGGLPTTAFLTADGELLGGGTFLDVERLRAALPRVLVSLRDMAAARSAMPSVSPAASTAGESLEVTSLEAQVLASYDAAHGGFGGAPKFPHVAPVRLSLARSEDSGDTAALENATRTLDAMGWSALYDEVEGGFYRCCVNADWTAPQREKLLASNAALLTLYLDAGVQTGTERWLARAGDVIRFIEERLRRQDGAWRAAAAVEGARVFTDATAVTVSALLRAADVFQDAALGKRAIDTFEHVLLAVYKPGSGVAHSAGGVRGLLVDQVACATAALDAWDATGNIVYRMMAEELVHYVLRTTWDADAGGLFDRDTEMYAAEPAQARLLKPFVLNCEAAVLLRRTADATGDGLFASRAVHTLESVFPAAASHGPLAAHYLIARRVILR